VKTGEYSLNIKRLVPKVATQMYSSPEINNEMIICEKLNEAQKFYMYE